MNNFVEETKKERERESWNENNLSKLKGEEKKRASQKGSEESRPLSGKENYDRADFADRLQSNSKLSFHATDRKVACTKHASSRSQ